MCLYQNILLVEVYPPAAQKIKTLLMDSAGRRGRRPLPIRLYYLCKPVLQSFLCLFSFLKKSKCTLDSAKTLQYDFCGRPMVAPTYFNLIFIISAPLFSERSIGNLPLCLLLTGEVAVKQSETGGRRDTQAIIDCNIVSANPCCKVFFAYLSFSKESR